MIENAKTARTAANLRYIESNFLFMLRDIKEIFTDKLEIYILFNNWSQLLFRSRNYGCA